jgi:hypothetical protein
MGISAALYFKNLTSLKKKLHIWELLTLETVYVNTADPQFND